MTASPCTDSPGRGARASRRALFLASRSPRRRQLLDEHALSHEAVHPGFEDSDLSSGEVTAGQWVAALAYLKAAAGGALVGARNASAFTVLGADTAIVKDGKLIGTPRDASDAERIIRTLVGGSHEVLTGVSFVAPGTNRRTFFVDRARVSLGNLTDEQIRAYVASEEWQGKAGGYNLRERLGAGWPIEFEGDPGTIMGLPMRCLESRLCAFESTLAESVA